MFRTAPRIEPLEKVGGRGPPRVFAGPLRASAARMAIDGEIKCVLKHNSLFTVFALLFWVVESLGF